MPPTIDYVLFCALDLTGFIINKLCAFYNKEISGHPVRLIFSVPNEYTPALSIDRYKETFDETSLYRYDPADITFWRCKTLVQMLYYVQSIGDHILVDHGIIFKHLNDIKGIDIGYACPLEISESSAKKSLLLLNEFYNLDADIIKIPLYDFSVMYLSQDLRVQVGSVLSKIIAKYPEHVSSPISYVIISAILYSINPSLNSASLCPDGYINICHSPLIKDFYSII